MSCPLQRKKFLTFFAEDFERGRRYEIGPLQKKPDFHSVIFFAHPRHDLSLPLHLRH